MSSDGFRKICANVFIKSGRQYKPYAEALLGGASERIISSYWSKIDKMMKAEGHPLAEYSDDVTDCLNAFIKDNSGSWRRPHEMGDRDPEDMLPSVPEISWEKVPKILATLTGVAS
jgi:hypothetical protein